MRKLKIDLRYSAADAESVIQTHSILDSELQRLGIGQLIYASGDLASSIDRQARDGFHQIGTTRMSSHPERGVVDETCRVHNIHNLYVASSSVFPTSGQASPTLTVMALALRLSQLLQRRNQLGAA
jgi:choline dehydrogenase-like flavoprotein